MSHTVYPFAGLPMFQYKPGESAYIISDSDAQAIVDEATVEPSSARKEIIEDLVTGLKTDSIWTTLDQIYMLGADEQISSLNWVAPAGTALTNNNSVNFVADSYWEFDAALNNYLSTGIDLDTLSNFAQNDAHISAWVFDPSSTNTVTGSEIVWGANDTTQVTQGFYSGSDTAFGSRMNSSGSSDSWTLTAGGAGLISIVRRGATSGEAYQNGASVGTSSVASSAVPANVDLYIGTRNDSDVPNSNIQSHASVGALLVGSQLSTAQLLNLHSRLSTYFTAIGAI